MSQGSQIRQGVSEARDAPKRAFVLLQRKTDLSRSRLLTGRQSARLTKRTDLLVRRMAAGDTPAPEPPALLPVVPAVPPPESAAPPPPAPPESAPPPTGRTSSPPGAGRLIRRKAAAPPAERPPDSGLRPEFIFDCEHCQQRIDATGFAMFAATQCPACSGLNPVPGRLDHYLLREALGEGGMGVVYRARDEHLHRDVALKIIRRDLLRDAGTAAQFVREARAAARLNHPNIVHIYAIGDIAGDPYIVMELLSRVRLDTLLAGGQPLPELLVMYTAYDMIRALDAARMAGLVHGDIKPANVLYNGHGQAKLIDFGLASFFQEKRGELWGTPLYMAPEKILQQGEDWRSDQFSLGLTLWTACAGRAPFDGKDTAEILRAILNEPLPDLGGPRPGIDATLQSVIARMCAKDPAERFAEYEEPLRLLKQGIMEARRALAGNLSFPPGLEPLQHREVG